MFASPDTLTLHDTLNHFPVPMFAAERESPHAPFRLLSVNTAHTRITGITHDSAHGALTSDILPADEARQVDRLYARCAEKQRIISYTETLHYHGIATIWDTTLQPIEMKGGAQRIVGTAMTYNNELPNSLLDDTDYFAAQAQMQLGHMRQFLDSLETRPDLPFDARERAMMVNGLTRGLDRLLDDMRRSVRRHKAEPLAQAQEYPRLV